MADKKMFLKIKRDQKEKRTWNTIRWDERSASGWETKTLECEEPSRPEFHQALAGLEGIVPVLIGVPAAWSENLKVNGVAFFYDEYGHRSVSIQSIKELEGFAAPLAVNVPACYAADGSALSELVDVLEAEAELYLAHNRAQMELALEQQGPQA